MSDLERTDLAQRCNRLAAEVKQLQAAIATPEVYAGVVSEVVADERERLAAELRRVTRERDVLLACRRGYQNCHECPDTDCCDNMNQTTCSDEAPDHCECHERDGSFVCDYCYARGYRGHMQPRRTHQSGEE